jgi:PAS domain S-box-containing protein
VVKQPDIITFTPNCAKILTVLWMTATNKLQSVSKFFLNGGGEMGELIRSIDWSATSLGAPEQWPATLRYSVGMMLSTKFPVLICWGKEYLQLYNDAFRPILGIAKHPKAMGASAKSTYSEIWESIGPMFADVMNGQPVGSTDFKVVLDRNGYLEDCYFDFSYSPIKDEKGEVGGILVICMETTDKYHAIDGFQAMNEEMTAVNEELAAANEQMAAKNEELATLNEELLATQVSLSRSEKLFRSIALNIPNALIIMIDKDHKFITIEGDIMEKMGYDSRNYAGKHPTEVGPPERYEESRHLYERVMSGERFSVERKLSTGEDYMVHFVPIKNEADEIDAGLIIALDITDIKQAEGKSAMLAAIIESSDDAIISKTLESVITSWNDSAERMFGYKSDEIIGETIYKLIPPDRQDEEPQILARLKSGERVEHFETKRLTKNGRLLDVSLSISPVKDGNGHIIGLSKIARDITERKLDETRKSDFIGMVSHELKTPLTSLNALIQVANAKLKNSGDAFLEGAMAKANMQVKRMTGMINGFLNISRLEAGKILIEKQPFEIRDLLEDILEETKLIVSSHVISISDCGSVTVNADRDKISSVVSNLISNAIKYSPQGKLIEIGCRLSGDNVIVSVKDEGMGINPQDLGKIFDRYYRVEANHMRHIAGFGIGLYLSAEIIKRHDGEIWAESESGKGSTFYFSLPIAG